MFQIMTTTTNAENLQYKIRFSLIVEQILALTSSINLIKEFKNLSSNLKQVKYVLH